MASIITAPWAKLMMRSTPNTSDRPDATSPYTPPSRTPLTTACRRRSVVTRGSGPGVLTQKGADERRAGPIRIRGAKDGGDASSSPLGVPLGHGEHRLGLGEARRANHHGLAALDLQERGRGIHVLAAVVELD